MSAMRLVRRNTCQERRSSKRLCGAGCVAQSAAPVSIRLKLAHQVKFGDRHAVIGSAGCLGSWRQHVDMEWSKEGWVVEIKPSSYEKILEYKFVIVLKDGGLLWESGVNRTLHVPDYGGAYEVIAQWDTTQEEPQIVPDPSLTMIWPPLSDEYLTSMAQLPQPEAGKGMDMYKQDRDAAAYEAEMEAELEQEKKRLAELQKQAAAWERPSANAPPTARPPPEKWTETPRFLSQRQSMVDPPAEQKVGFDPAGKEEKWKPDRLEFQTAAKPKPVEVDLPKARTPAEHKAPAPAEAAAKKPTHSSQAAERLSTLMALDEERKEIIRIKAVLMELSMAELRSLGRERGVRGDTRTELVELLVAPMRIATVVTATTNGAAKASKGSNGAATHRGAVAAASPPPPPPPETEESRMKALSEKSMLELRTLAKARGLRGDTKKELVQLLARLR